jgi:hypothetical protein
MLVRRDTYCRDRVRVTSVRRDWILCQPFQRSPLDVDRRNECFRRRKFQHTALSCANVAIRIVRQRQKFLCDELVHLRVRESVHVQLKETL